MQDVKELAQKIVDEYAPQLLEKGIYIDVSKTYFESYVHEKHNRGGIAETIERKRLRKQERKKGYHFQNNRYHCIVLTVLPVEANVLKKERCKQYAYVIRKVERAYIGENPEKTAYEVNKVLNKIEKRIVRILRDARDRLPQEICAETWRDAVRYPAAGARSGRTGAVFFHYSDPVFSGDQQCADYCSRAGGRRGGRRRRVFHV